MEEGKPVERIGDYEFLDRLAVGGMGQLWRVRHVKLDAVYVAKVLRPELREDPEFVKRFLNEARLVANLRHPNVVQVFDFDEERMLYLMEYVEGMDLERLMRRRRNFELADKRTITEVVADTIGFAHREHDLIHRDIKPSNVLIAITDPDATIQASHIKLTDFGIARVLSIDQRVTMSSGVVMGTVHYMAPEQFEGHADKPSDVYAIGVLYYQLLTGRLPFEGPTAFVVRDKHLSEIPPAPHELNPEVPLEDSAIVMKCLEKDPAARYQDGAELHEAIATISPTTRTMTIPHRRRRRPAAPAPPPRVAGRPGAARPEAREPKPRRWLRHFTRAAIALAAVVVLALLATVVLKPRYEVRWNTLRSDPQDTPRGIKVWVCPKIAFRLFWWPVGTITDKAPPPWANWTTWFSSIHVRLSDGFYREFVITCSPAEGSDSVDFGGATFEELARKHDANIRKDPKGIPDYINAVLVPDNVASANSLPDVVAGIERVAGLLAKTEGLSGRKTNLDAYRAAASAISNAASALANGDWTGAGKLLAESETHLAAIADAYKKKLPDDFMFRATVRAALAEVKSRAAKARRILDVLEPLADSPTSITYTLKRYSDAREAVAAYLVYSPGPAAAPLLKASDDPAAMEKALQEATKRPAPIQTLLDYLAKLDAAIATEAPAPQRQTWATKLLEATDEAAGAGRLEPAAWLAKCLSRESLACLAALNSLWAGAHRHRVAAAARRCHDFAAKALETAAASAQPDATFKSAEAALEAVRAAANVPEDLKRQATALLSTCCVRHAIALFTTNPAASSEQLANILVLMDRGLTELPGCDPKARDEALALRETLRALGPARQALAASIRANFSQKDRFTGEAGTLFSALDAYEQLARQVASRGGFPACRAALRPFERLAAEACRGFSLPGATACWLLAKALEECQEGRYAEAAALLRAFEVAPGQQKPSPLKRLLPREVGDLATRVAKVAEDFDQGAAAPGAQPNERWRRQWERRLAAASTLPAKPTLPASAERKAEMAALAGLAERLVGHFRDLASAEETLRGVEAQVSALVVREGGKVKPNPAKATPAAIARALAAVAGLADDKRFATADHPDRVAALRRDLSLIKAGTEGLSKQLDALLAKGEARAALDLLEAAGGALGKDAQLALTRKALALWMTAATAALEAGDFDKAAATLKAIAGHPQAKNHAQDPQVSKVVGEATTLANYCEGRKALAAGPKSFPDALARLKEAGECRDAPALVAQLEVFQTANASGSKAPVAALEKFDALLKTKDINPAIASAAQAAARGVRASFLVAAASCVSAFNKRLVTGEWERYLDRTSVSDDEVARIKAFLDSVEDLRVEEPAVQPEGQFAPEQLRATLKRTRTLKFTLTLSSARVPMTVVQTITWTLKYARGEGNGPGRWLIAGWEEAN